MSKQHKHYFTLKTNYIKQQDQSEVRTVNLGFILPFGHKLQLGWYFSILGVEFGQLLLKLVILLHQCFITFHTLLLIGGEHFLELQNTTARNICSLKSLTDISKGSCHHLVADEGSKNTLIFVPLNLTTKPFIFWQYILHAWVSIHNTHLSQSCFSLQCFSWICDHGDECRRRSSGGHGSGRTSGSRGEGELLRRCTLG